MENRCPYCGQSVAFGYIQPAMECVDYPETVYVVCTNRLCDNEGSHVAQPSLEAYWQAHSEPKMRRKNDKP